MIPRRRAQRIVAVAAGAVAATVLLVSGARAQVPTELPTELPTGLPTPAPTAEPSPGPSPEPTRTASPSPSPSERASTTSGRTGASGGSSSSEGTPGSAPEPPGSPSTHEPAPAPSGGTADLGTVGVGSADGPVEGTGQPAPEVAPGRDDDRSSVGGDAPAQGGAGTGGAILAGSPAIAAAIPGAYSLTVLAALLGVGVLSMTLSLTDRGLLLARDPATGGTNVERTRRWRVMAGTGLLGAAALVAIIGYLRISIETLVPVQLVYLASAGFGVVVLAAAGGALLISEQLRADESRIRDLEDSLALLADRLGPAVTEPPRLLARRTPAETPAPDETRELQPT